MIDLYNIAAGASSNVYKVIIALEEMGLSYRLESVDIYKGEQFKQEFLAISPNGRLPAIVDHDPAEGGEPVKVFESGAILTYLADKSGLFLAPTSRPRSRSETLQWVFWQMAGLGPMLGQYIHFKIYTPEPQPYSLHRYSNELNRLCGVVNQRLADRPYLAGDEYTIADMICYPALNTVNRLARDIVDEVPNLDRWRASLSARPAIQRAYAIKGSVPVVTIQSNPTAWHILFAQTAKNMEGVNADAK